MLPSRLRDCLSVVRARKVPGLVKAGAAICHLLMTDTRISRQRILGLIQVSQFLLVTIKLIFEAGDLLLIVRSVAIECTYFPGQITDYYQHHGHRHEKESGDCDQGYLHARIIAHHPPTGAGLGSGVSQAHPGTWNSPTGLTGRTEVALGHYSQRSRLLQDHPQGTAVSFGNSTHGRCVSQVRAAARGNPARTSVRIG